jgi:hypothetical protein
VKRVVHASSQGQARRRCSVSRRAEDAIRAGTWTSLRRIVAVVALPIAGPARVPAARVRLNAITARTSQAAFGVNLPDGRWAKAEFFRSAWTCSMMAWPRWVLSAVMVSRVLVVKKAWKMSKWPLKRALHRDPARPEAPPTDTIVITGPSQPAPRKRQTTVQAGLDSN